LTDQIDVLLDILEINLRLKTLVAIGGPVVYGTLATDVPNFEVFGEVVREARDALPDIDTGMIAITPAVLPMVDVSQYVIKEGPSGISVERA
jgi:hypothetical protein